MSLDCISGKLELALAKSIRVFMCISTSSKKPCKKCSPNMRPDWFVKSGGSRASARFISEAVSDGILPFASASATLAGIAVLLETAPAASTFRITTLPPASVLVFEDFVEPAACGERVEVDGECTVGAAGVETTPAASGAGAWTSVGEQSMMLCTSFLSSVSRSSSAERGVRHAANACRLRQRCAAADTASGSPRQLIATSPFGASTLAHD
eukprot:101014-Pleurochrysis_carterae.AAC.10